MLAPETQHLIQIQLWNCETLDINLGNTPGVRLIQFNKGRPGSIQSCPVSPRDWWELIIIPNNESLRFLICFYNFICL